MRVRQAILNDAAAMAGDEAKGKDIEATLRKRLTDWQTKLTQWSTMAVKPEVKALLTDASAVWITYTAKPDDPSILPGYLKKAITTQLAFLLTTPLTSSESLAQRVAGEAKAALEQAILDDARRSPPPTRVPFWDEER